MQPLETSLKIAAVIGSAMYMLITIPALSRFTLKPFGSNSQAKQGAEFIFAPGAMRVLRIAGLALAGICCLAFLSHASEVNDILGGIGATVPVIVAALVWTTRSLPLELQYQKLEHAGENEGESILSKWKRVEAFCYFLIATSTIFMVVILGRSFSVTS